MSKHPGPANANHMELRVGVLAKTPVTVSGGSQNQLPSMSQKEPEGDAAS